jgi:hypothetical protein
MHARLAVSINTLDGSGVATGGGVDGGGITGGGAGPPGGVGVPEGGTGLDGIPGGNGDPPSGKIGGIGGMKLDPEGVSGTTMAVVGGGASGISGATGTASGPAPAGISIASGEGSAFITGSPGTSERRLPQRVLAICAPSVRTVSPAGRVIRFFVQKIRLPTR